MRSIRLTAAGVLGAMCALGVPAALAKGGPDLKALEHAVNVRYHIHGQHVPMMWMVSGIAHGLTHGGVRGMQVVIYEKFSKVGDRDGLVQVAQTQLNDDWSLMVRERAVARDGEDDMVWVQPHGKRVRMLVVSMDGDELDLVQMELSPEALAKWEKKHGD